MNQPQGLLLVNKPPGKTAFSLVAALRRILGVKTIGHAGTLDPFATGVVVMLVGRSCTRLSDKFLNADKAYRATLRLGITTDTYDCDGREVARSEHVPTLEDLELALTHFQGEIDQIPPMFSAKKQGGKKLYELARQGKTVERPAVKVKVVLQILSYSYPHVEVTVACSKGTYVRSLAYDIGQHLGCGAHLVQLERTRSGNFQLAECLDGALLYQQPVDGEAVRSRLLAPEGIIL